MRPIGAFANKLPGVFPGDLVGYFGLSAAVAGAAVLLTYYLGDDFLLWWKARKWTAGQCTVVRSDPSLVYRVEAGGRGYEATRIGIGDWQGVYALGDPQVGARLPCFYDPASPGDALLSRDYSGWWWLPGAWLLAAFMVVSSGPSLAVGLWRWATYKPDPPLTWGQWVATFYENGAWMLSVVGFTALLIGLPMVWFMSVRPWWHWWQVQQWPAAECEMTKSEVRAWGAGSGRDATGGYVLSIAFRYTVAGREYTADTYAPWRLGGTEWLLQKSRASEMEEMQKQFAVGTRHTCYVSPREPEMAYLSRARNNYATYVSAIGPFITLLGLIILASRR